MKLDTIIIWLTMLIAVTLVFVSYRLGSKKYFNDLSLSQFITTSASLYGVTINIQLIHLAIYSDELRNFLGGNIFALFIGSFALIWISIQQIKGLF